MSRFIAIDGEGITRRGRHRYAFLAASTGEELTDLEGLDAARCFDFLVTLGERYPGCTIVGYGLSYDFCMMLKGEARADCKELYLGFPTRLAEVFEAQWVARRSFRLSRWPIQWAREGGKPRRLTPCYTIWDVFSFFQAPFVTALEKNVPEHKELIETIKRGKARRSTFRARDLPFIQDYCRKELAALVHLMERLNADLGTAGLKLARWDGAGACAAALLRREKIKEHMQECPEAVQRAAQHAYAGGRMELLRYGHHRGTIHHYDINSAYPHAIAKLPSLAKARWVQDDCTARSVRRDCSYALDSQFSLWHVRWSRPRQTPRHQDIWHPFFWRAPTGEIYYPAEGEGWFWFPEVKAAMQARSAGHWNGSIEILNRLSPVWPEPPSTPFAFVPALYEQRRQWKAEGIGAEKVLKLSINSLYGKMAQHVGGHGGKPGYHQLEFAGWVTSLTRARLYEALSPVARTAGIMVATDGVYSLAPLDLACSDLLGDWSYSPHLGATVVQSGVYWTDDADGEHMFCRGFDRGSLARARILGSWKRGRHTWPASLTRFIGLGSALRSSAAWQTFGTWHTADRSLSLTMRDTKRAGRSGVRPDLRLIRTRPAGSEHALFDPLSHPYPLPWRGDAALPVAMIDGVPERDILEEMDMALI